MSELPSTQANLPETTAGCLSTFPMGGAKSENVLWVTAEVADRFVRVEGNSKATREC